MDGGYGLDMDIDRHRRRWTYKEIYCEELDHVTLVAERHRDLPSAARTRKPVG